ncbi:hypothetical protein HR12_36465 [Microbacterium sp. SUBG005]|nr:hypothetical protein HR12_36465 [Microbacterium sp. SUBG005]
MVFSSVASSSGMRKVNPSISTAPAAMLTAPIARRSFKRRAPAHMRPTATRLVALPTAAAVSPPPAVSRTFIAPQSRAAMAATPK